VGKPIVVFDLYGTLLSIATLNDVLREYTPMSETFVEVWRSRQLQLANACTATGRFMDFDRITLTALHEIAPRFHLRLGGEDQKHLLDAWAHLTAFDDVAVALERLMQTDTQLVVLTNAVESTARNALDNAGIGEWLPTIISAAKAQVYKPHQGVYGLVPGACNVDPSDVLFVSAHDWDASGARQFGFESIWVQRVRSATAIRAERTISTLTMLPDLIAERKSA
jgi:2-haloacid dehalogenase